MQFADFEVILRRIRDAFQKSPAFRPRLQVLEDAVVPRVGEEGPASLFYSGCAVSVTAKRRAHADFDKNSGFYAQLLRFWNIDKVKVYEVNLERIVVDPFEFRGQRSLQIEEHTLIAMRFPLSLNSSPGGFNHDYRVDLYTPSPLPAFPRQETPPSISQDLRRHFERMYMTYAERAGAKGIHPAALAAQIDLAMPRFLLLDRVPIVAISKDITQEAFEHQHDDLNYRQRLAKPGPQATNMALLHQYGVNPFGANTEERLLTLPPTTDLFMFFAHH